MNHLALEQALGKDVLQYCVLPYLMPSQKQVRKRFKLVMKQIITRNWYFVYSAPFLRGPLMDSTIYCIVDNRWAYRYDVRQEIITNEVGRTCICQYRRRKRMPSGPPSEHEYSDISKIGLRNEWCKHVKLLQARNYPKRATFSYIVRRLPIIQFEADELDLR
jgi:hypothetical protein